MKSMDFIRAMGGIEDDMILETVSAMQGGAVQRAAGQRVRPGTGLVVHLQRGEVHDHLARAAMARCPACPPRACAVREANRPVLGGEFRC